MKTCNKCSTLKELTDFYKNKAMKDGLGNYCKECEKAHQKSSWCKNKAIKTARHSRYVENNREKINLISRKSKSRNKAKISLTSRFYYINNKNTINKKAKIYYQLNRGDFIARYKKRETLKAQACPAWLNAQHWIEMKDMYKLAQQLSTVENIQYHVDHIVPLQGKNVCGLHVPWNLQLLTATQNLQKHNKLEVLYAN